MLAAMKMLKKKAYQSPESEELRFFFETNFLATVNGGDKPVDDSDDGDTEGWGWN